MQTDRDARPGDCRLVTDDADVGRGYDLPSTPVAPFTLTPREARRVKRWADACRKGVQVKWSQENDQFLYDALLESLAAGDRPPAEREEG